MTKNSTILKQRSCKTEKLPVKGLPFAFPWAYDFELFINKMIAGH